MRAYAIFNTTNKRWVFFNNLADALNTRQYTIDEAEAKQGLERMQSLWADSNFIMVQFDIPQGE